MYTRFTGCRTAVVGLTRTPTPAVLQTNTATTPTPRVECYISRPLPSTAVSQTARTAPLQPAPWCRRASPSCSSRDTSFAPALRRTPAENDRPSRPFGSCCHSGAPTAAQPLSTGVVPACPVREGNIRPKSPCSQIRERQAAIATPCVPSALDANGTSCMGSAYLCS
jgi:hypothetical protein